MRKICLVLLIVSVCLTVVFSAFGQTENITLIGGINSEKPVSRMVWDDSGEWITIVTSDMFQQCHIEPDSLVQPDDSTVEARRGQGFDFAEKAYSSADVSEAGIMAALSDDWKTIILYDEPMNPDKALRTIDPGFMMLSISVSKDGAQVLADSAEQIRTVVFDVKDGSTVYDLDGFQTAAPVYDSTLSADGSYVVWHSRGTFAVQNAADETFGKTISLWDFASAYELSPDNSLLAVGMINDDYESGAVLFFDPLSGVEKGRTLLGKNSPYGLSFSDDGSVLWASDAETVYRIDPDTFALTSQITITESDIRISRIASSPDGTSLAVLLSSGEVYLIKG